jgi:hypothetical protein
MGFVVGFLPMYIGYALIIYFHTLFLPVLGRRLPLQKIVRFFLSGGMNAFFC